MHIPESARHVITSGVVAHVATIDPDGRPHVTCAWVGLEDDHIVIGTIPDQRKLHNLRRDPRVTLSMQTDKVNPYGLLEYLVVYGRAEVTEGGGAELLARLAKTYIGPDAEFPPMPNPPPGYVTRITVERLGGIGPWRDRA